MRKPISQKQIAKEIGISGNGLSSALKKGDFKVSMLEKISKALEVSPCIFLDVYDDSKKIIGDYAQVGEGNINNNNNTLAKSDKLMFKYKTDLEVLKVKNAGLEKEVALLREMNELLKKKI